MHRRVCFIPPKQKDRHCLSFCFGGEGGIHCSLSRLAAPLRRAIAASFAIPWRSERVPDSSVLALRIPSEQKQKGYACTLFVFGGEGGIRTHVPVMDKTISSRSRYDLFDTSPNMFNSCRKLAKKRELPEGTVKNQNIKLYM